MHDQNPDPLGQTLKLPCGVHLRNRIAKAAMTEGLADGRNRATEAHGALYRRWAASGAALLLTGNVMIDRRFLEHPANVAIDGPQDCDALDRLRAYSAAGAENRTALWMQINHPGRQTAPGMGFGSVGPSAIAPKVSGKDFGTPHALTEAEIEDVIERFAHVARIAKDTGFAGVQIHAAHGYLISSFLSPAANHRTDRWGGSLENRARLLLETIAAVRAAVGASFPVSVKLNSADFQRGGFDAEDSLAVIGRLNDTGLDMLELSGGSYEQPINLGGQETARMMQRQRASTVAREAYFLDFAMTARARCALPLMVTGGFRSGAGMRSAIAEGACDLVGIARPFCTEPDLPKRLFTDSEAVATMWEHRLNLGPWLLGRNSPFRRIRVLNDIGSVAWYMCQLAEMGRGHAPDLSLSFGQAIKRAGVDGAAAMAALERPGAG